MGTYRGGRGLVWKGLDNMLQKGIHMCRNLFNQGTVGCDIRASSVCGFGEEVECGDI